MAVRAERDRLHWEWGVCRFYRHFFIDVVKHNFLVNSNGAEKQFVDWTESYVFDTVFMLIELCSLLLGLNVDKAEVCIILTRSYHVFVKWGKPEFVNARVIDFYLSYGFI